MFGNWKVWECCNCGKRYYTYGDSTPEDCWNGCGAEDNFAEIKDGQLYSEDYITIIENELEDANWHSVIELPSKLYTRIKDLDIADNIKSEIVKAICEEIYNAI